MEAAAIAAALRDERAATESRREQLCRDLEGYFAAAADVATDDEHDPEGATLAYERSRTKALIDQADAHLAEITIALGHLEEGRYNTCERCGGAIGLERLQARPVARTCVGCADGQPR